MSGSASRLPRAGHRRGAPAEWRSTPMRRIDAATAEKLRAAMSAKVQKQTPNPASEATLRRMIAGIAAGKPNLRR